MALPGVRQKYLHGLTEDVTLEALPASPEPAQAPGVVLRRVSEVEQKPVDWLWEGRIALGKLSLLTGDPDAGKSFLACAMAANVTQGFDWPDGAPCEPGSVVMITAEDDISDTVLARLEAHGANLDKVHFLESVNRGRRKDCWFSIVEDLGALSKALDQTEGTRLVIVDPISAYLDGIDSHVNAAVRGAMGPLAALSAKHNVALLGISHLNKSEGSALYRVSGSLVFVALSRAAFLLARDREQSERRLLLRIKNSLSPLRSGLAFSIVSNERGLPVLAWEEDAVDMTANDALMPAIREKGETKLEAVKRWLRETLANGPVLQETIKADAEALGISYGTLRNAQSALGVKSRKQTFSGQWEWVLPTPGEALAPSTEPAFRKASSQGAKLAPSTELKRDEPLRAAPGKDFSQGAKLAPSNETNKNADSSEGAKPSGGIGKIEPDYEEGEA